MPTILRHPQRPPAAPVTPVVLLLAVPATPGPALATTPGDLNHLAAEGRFDQVLASLQASPDAAQDPQVAALGT